MGKGHLRYFSKQHSFWRQWSKPRRHSSRVGWKLLVPCRYRCISKGSKSHRESVFEHSKWAQSQRNLWCKPLHPRNTSHHYDWQLPTSLKILGNKFICHYFRRYRPRQWPMGPPPWESFCQILRKLLTSYSYFRTLFSHKHPDWRPLLIRVPFPDPNRRTLDNAVETKCHWRYYHGFK